MDRKSLAMWLLRIGLASVFLYAAFASFLELANWIGFLPVFLRHIFPEAKLLVFFSLYEIGLSIWILSAKKTFFAAVLSSFTLLGIITTSLGALDITFRDLGLVCMSLSLAILSLEK